VRQKFGFIKRLDKGLITTVKDLELAIIVNLKSYNRLDLNPELLIFRSGFYPLHKVTHWAGVRVYPSSILIGTDFYQGHPTSNFGHYLFGSKVS